MTEEHPTTVRTTGTYVGTWQVEFYGQGAAALPNAQPWGPFKRDASRGPGEHLRNLVISLQLICLPAQLAPCAATQKSKAITVGFCSLSEIHPF
jgi:hypothetical protein